MQLPAQAALALPLGITRGISSGAAVLLHQAGPTDVNRYPAPREGRDRAPAAAAAAARAMGAQVGDQHSGCAQVQVPRWPADLRMRCRAAREAGHESTWLSEACRDLAAGGRGGTQTCCPCTTQPAPGICLGWGRPSSVNPHGKGGASARRARALRIWSIGLDVERLNKSPTKARPHRETELCASAANRPGSLLFSFLSLLPS